MRKRNIGKAPTYDSKGGSVSETNDVVAILHETLGEQAFPTREAEVGEAMAVVGVDQGGCGRPDHLLQVIVVAGLQVKSDIIDDQDGADRKTWISEKGGDRLGIGPGQPLGLFLGFGHKARRDDGRGLVDALESLR